MRAYPQNPRWVLRGRFDTTTSRSGTTVGEHVQSPAETHRSGAKKATFGKKIVFTNLKDASTETILGYQKSSCQIEDGFHHLKDRDLVAYHPGYHWTDSKIRVHAFVCVLALFSSSCSNFVAKKTVIGMSCKVLIEELEDITMIILVYRDRKTVKKDHRALGGPAEPVRTLRPRAATPDCRESRAYTKASVKLTGYIIPRGGSRKLESKKVRLNCLRVYSNEEIASVHYPGKYRGVVLG